MGKSEINVGKTTGLIVASLGVLVYWAETRERVSC